MIVERETVRVYSDITLYPEIRGSTDLVHRAYSVTLRDPMRLIPCAGWWIPSDHYQIVGTYPTCIRCIAGHINTLRSVT